MRDQSLAGKVALITGAARGLGRVFARALAGEGVSIAIADNVAGDDVVAEIGSDRAMSVVTDVSCEASVKDAVAAIIERFGSIDILINNAAIASVLQPVSPLELDVELWDKVMAVNIRGPFLMAKHVAPHMIASGHGKIINISSGVAYKGAKGLAHYVTSKAAVLGLTRSLARDLGQYDICVNTIAPGMILNESLLANQPGLEQTRKAASAARSLTREGRPQDLIGTLLFLASDDSAFITGQTIVLDGGTLML